ncbi:MAG: cupin domain-containing protein [bacterium]|nr:cupin domain-containing protein [bacterium]
MTVRKPQDVPLDPVTGGTSTARQVLIGEELSPHFAIRRFVMEPGGGMPLHTNTVEHGQYVLTGAATIRIGDETIQVTAGDSVHIPANVPHSYQVEGADRFEFLCVVPNGPDQITVVEEAEA